MFRQPLICVKHRPERRADVEKPLFFGPVALLPPGQVKETDRMSRSAGQRHFDQVPATTRFFVLGCQKSGTTWVQRLLDAHPNVRCGGEGHLADLLLPLLKQAVDAYNQRQEKRRSSGLSVQLSDTDFFHLARSACDLCFAQYLREAGTQAGAIRAVGDKTPESAIRMPDLIALYPEARFIHVIRDGRDGAVSGWHHWTRLRDRGEVPNPQQFASFADYATYYASNHWVGYIRHARSAAAAIPGRYLEVKYEDLHTEAQTQLRRLFEFLSVDASDESVAGALSGASFRRLSGGRERGEEDAQSFFRKGVVGDWRIAFNDDAIERFDAVAGDLLVELGYAETAGGTPNANRSETAASGCR